VDTEPWTAVIATVPGVLRGMHRDAHAVVVVANAFPYSHSIYSLSMALCTLHGSEAACVAPSKCGPAQKDIRTCARVGWETVL